jgi:hypothetical protein
MHQNSLRSVFHEKLTMLAAASAFLLLAAVAGTALAGPSPAEPPESLDLAKLPAQQGIKELAGFSGRPDAGGVLKTWRVVLPPFERACFFSGLRTKADNWPADHNQVLPWIIKSDFRELLDKKGLALGPKVSQASRHALQVLLKLADGQAMALLPIAGPKTMSWLEVDDSGQLLLRLGTLGTEPVSCDAPVLAWSRGPDVYAACHDVWDLALHCPAVRGRTAWRSEKTYPEAFLYLGWCTWEQYKKKIDERLLLTALDQIEASGLPIRWFLVDDGHQTQTDMELISFAPDARQFPRGWAPILARRSPDRVRWMGLWHCFDGLWKLIRANNELGDLNQCLTPATSRNIAALMPKGDPRSAQKFYDAYIGSVKHSGFDFVKIDVQAQDLKLCMGHANAVEAAAVKSQALEESCRRDMSGLINCMAQNAVCAFNTRSSAVTRCSIDYQLGKADRGKSHLQQSYHNTLWQGQTVWPDHDMFHSCDPHCGQMMAVSKALSGAPVYLSDDPKEFVAQYIRPLCYSDGKLLRPLAPAVPLPDSVFADGLKEPAGYRAIAPLANGCAAVVVYNLQQGEKPTTVAGAVRADDYRCASAMMQPYPGPWKLPAEGLVVFDWQEGKGQRLSEAYRFNLQGFQGRLLLLCPVHEGWAVVGRADKYLGPAAVESALCTPDRLKLSLTERGPLVIWAASGRPRAEGLQFASLGNGFWKADLPVGTPREPATVITVERSR